MSAYRYCNQAIKFLPHCADITRKYCSRFSRILLVDGKYVAVKGFESFYDADSWLNAYFLRRRMKKLTDCDGVFKKLNGMCPLAQCIKNGVDLPSIF
jgi:hypothetical protein